MSNFTFLAAEFPAVHEAAVEAERQAAVSPTAAAFFAGKAVEVVGWFRRAPVPYLELKSITVDGVTRNSYARHGRYVLAGFLVLAGLGLIIASFFVH